MFHESVTDALKMIQWPSSCDEIPTRAAVQWLLTVAAGGLKMSRIEFNRRSESGISYMISVFSGETRDCEMGVPEGLFQSMG